MHTNIHSNVLVATPSNLQKCTYNKLCRLRMTIIMCKYYVFLLAHSSYVLYIASFQEPGNEAIVYGGKITMLPAAVFLSMNASSVNESCYLFRFTEVDLSIAVVVQLAVYGLNGCKLQFVAQCQHLCSGVEYKGGGHGLCMWSRPWHACVHTWK